MRHGKKFNHLGRQAPHRKAMLSNMSASLFLYKRITTTLAKAKELKKHVEPLVTRAKEDTTHNRRVAFSFLQNKEAIKLLFGEVAEKVGNRPGGYTRIIKTGYRAGDNAEMCIIELVDFNELMLKDSKPAKKTTRRSRRGSGKAKEEVKADASASADKKEAADSSTSSPKPKANKEKKAEEPGTEEVSPNAEASPADKETASPKPEAAEPSDTNAKAEEDSAEKGEDGEKDKKPE